MSDQIDFYFTSTSPFAFLGHKTLVQMAAKHSKKIEYKPFNLMGVWANSGAVMPNERPPVRQRYRLIELQRIADQRGIKIVHKPTNFPTNPTAADLCICALINANEDPSGFYESVGAAMWIHDRLVSDETVLHELLTEAGHDADRVLEDSKASAAANLREAYTDEAVANDAIGAPAYVYNAEVFWGQDRLELLEEMIASGRSAYTPD